SPDSTSVKAVESAATLMVSAPTGSYGAISTSTSTSPPAMSSATATAALLTRSNAPVTPRPARASRRFLSTRPSPLSGDVVEPNRRRSRPCGRVAACGRPALSCSGWSARCEQCLSTVHRLVCRLSGRGSIGDARDDADRACLQCTLPCGERVEGVPPDGDLVEPAAAVTRYQLDGRRGLIGVEGANCQVRPPSHTAGLDLHLHRQLIPARREHPLLGDEAVVLAEDAELGDPHRDVLCRAGD